MANFPTRKKKRDRKFPGHRMCLNHSALSEMFKSPVPEICPSCFANTATHQIQLIALNNCGMLQLRYTMMQLDSELQNVKAILREFLEREDSKR